MTKHAPEHKIVFRESNKNMESEQASTFTVNPIIAGALDLRDAPGTEQEHWVFEPVVGTMRPARRLPTSIRVLLGTVVGIFTCIGLLFTGVFVAMQFGLLNVRGSSIQRDQFFASLPKAQIYAAVVPKKATATSCVQQGENGKPIAVCAWNQSAEWQTVRSGLVKDKAVILKVSQQTGVPARMLAATVAPEQLRFFSSNRESFKRYFEPMKILGTMTQFSYGIAGFKQETAKQVEQYTVDRNSPFYAGDGMAKLVAYPAGANASKELFNRLTDEKDHYYSYLYAALFIKELKAQWMSEGYDISGRPDVITTLFNIGFRFSHPKADPEMGGTTITLHGTKYSYGELGTDFYRSDELTSIFPQP